MSAGHPRGCIGGNQFRLLENGEEFFHRVFECTAMAEREMVRETFILFEGNVGKALHAALLKAAARRLISPLMVMARPICPMNLYLRF